MKSSKSAGPSGVVEDIMKAVGEAETKWVTDVCNAVVKDGRIPKDWSKKWLLNVYKGKGDALACGSNKGIKLMKHAMKRLEKVIEVICEQIVKIDNLQFGIWQGGAKQMLFL